MQGFLNLNKPPGITSHDCVARVRRLLRLKRVGHGGTLDPAATGVLPLALGAATRLLQFLPPDKAYRATIRLGVSTTTDDLQGKIISATPVQHLHRAEVEAALKQFVGKIAQVPPAYSAIQVKGKRLYELARSGKMVEVKARTVEIYQIKVLDWRAGAFPEIDLHIVCGPGTYIRALARDLGAFLQIGGTLASLTRTYSSGFHLADSLTFDQLAALVERGAFQPVSENIALRHLQAVILSLSNAHRWCQGQKILDFRLENLETALESVRTDLNFPFSSKALVRVYREDASFLGIGQILNSANETLLVPQVVLNSNQ
ncbi:MAG: tRNA pseudouridine(55) synthase TruB [Oscillatoriaceae bacterium SKW80]|nr:tRNA pseudouridine(55) synthase TruB [Oscillatoriaceae bacterium SKYG93]MCX8119491.1 tRNA pseudouridine(55) synthase TruB [Oscillatoriaceae bacterium SKW80]MDW8454958.1 tRNA pseudouridine(55) synthase TruB [Oscillatoriaceae cyanobacterium SKYGB_i_bin93]HIK28263.1 tRNA pseudouridine(55) synthase TruB [Oscillatoriaceae cyanobacterium M7585_C2015_266]